MNTFPTILEIFGAGGFILALVIFVVFVLLIRLIGAWMLRINEIINLQKDILEELKKQNEKSK